MWTDAIKAPLSIKEWGFLSGQDEYCDVSDPYAGLSDRRDRSTVKAPAV